MCALAPGRAPPFHVHAAIILLCAQFCFSGDHTVEATERAIGEAAAGGGDDGEPAYVFVVSDANLRRYGIPPSALGACTYVIIHKQGGVLDLTLPCWALQAHC